MPLNTMGTGPAPQPPLWGALLTCLMVAAKEARWVFSHQVGLLPPLPGVEKLIRLLSA